MIIIIESVLGLVLIVTLFIGLKLNITALLIIDIVLLLSEIILGLYSASKLK